MACKLEWIELRFRPDCGVSFLIFLVVLDAYGDEKDFQCDGHDGSPGCQNQCYMHYAPISLPSFWIISVSRGYW